MRCLTSVLIFFIAVSLLAGQKSITLESSILGDKRPTVTGHLKNYHQSYNKDLVISYTLLCPDFKGLKQGVAEISEGGDFEIILDKNYPYQKLRIRVGNLYKGFLIVSEDLHIQLDLNAVSSKADDFSSKAVEFSGTDGRITSFFNGYYEYKPEKKFKLRSEINSTLRNRTSQVEFKVRQLKEHYENFGKLEKAFAKKNGSEYLWLIENERDSEYYGDLLSIFIGRPVPRAIWQEVLEYEALIVSELSNRFYGILATKLWSHEEKEVRAFSRMIFKTKASTEEEKKEIDRFMIEQDKKKAGVSYDNEVYAKGVQAYLAKYDEQLANAKLDLFLQKAEDLPKGKRGLVLIKGQPLDLLDRRKYVEAALPLFEIDWQSKLMSAEFEKEVNLVEGLNQILKSAPSDVPNPKLGSKVAELASGGVLWKNESKSPSELIRKIKTFYKDNNLIVYFWDFDCTACITDIRRSALNFDDMEGRPLKILTIAMGQDVSEVNWQTTLSEASARGEHMLLNNQMSGKVRSYFQFPASPAVLYFDSSSEYKPYKVMSIVSLDLYELLGPNN